MGAHISRKATENGYKVIGLARKPAGDEPYEMRTCDIQNCDSIKTTLRDQRQNQSLYGLINVAGIASMNLALATPFQTMERIVRVNLLGTMYCSTIVGKMLVKRKTGRIINLSTIAVPLSLKGESIYVGSKAGVEGFSKAFAREMADFNITVNVIAPGPVDTDLIAKVPSAKIDEIVMQQTIQRKSEKDDIWNVASILLDKRSEMISGQIINVGGV